MLRKCLFAVMLSAAGTLAQASTVIDFDALTPFQSQNPTIAGLSFTSPGLTNVWINNPNGNGTPSLINGYGSLTIAPVGGGSFDLLGFDMVISWYNEDVDSPVSLTSFFAGGGSATQTLALTQQLQTFSFLGLTGLASVVIEALSDQSPPQPPFGYPGYWLMDNLVVDNVTTGVVPLPAAAWLFGAGLFGLLGAARRRGTA